MSLSRREAILASIGGLTAAAAASLPAWPSRRWLRRPPAAALTPATPAPEWRLLLCGESIDRTSDGQQARVACNFEGVVSSFGAKHFGTLAVTRTCDLYSAVVLRHGRPVMSMRLRHSLMAGDIMNIDWSEDAWAENA
jgi:hypothetical protein